jgi:hypothetical protein
MQQQGAVRCTALLDHAVWQMQEGPLGSGRKQVGDTAWKRKYCCQQVSLDDVVSGLKKYNEL